MIVVNEENVRLMKYYRAYLVVLTEIFKMWKLQSGRSSGTIDGDSDG